MVTKKYLNARGRSTPENIKLFDTLKEKGIPALIDFWDGHKHIDIAIPKAKINIEVDGIQHNIRSKQALADLKRTYYSFKKGYFTLRLPNSLIKDHFGECVSMVIELVKENEPLA